MTVNIRRDVVFTRLVLETPYGDIVSGPWMPVTYPNVRERQGRLVARRGDRVIYRVNCRLKPPQEPK